MARTTIALFPLHTVLFPGGPLHLRIFEPRYLDMVSRCLREESGFGVALIVAGQEAGGPARTVRIGTLARIVDFERLKDGLLGITAQGERRFRIESVRREPDGLNVCDVQWLAQEPVTALPPEHTILAALLSRALDRIGAAYGRLVPRYEDASWVGMRLAEILPLPVEARQELLELDDALERLRRLRAQVSIIDP